MEKKLSALKRGDTFSLFNLSEIKWVVLQVSQPATPEDEALYFCEAAEDLFQRTFDEDNPVPHQEPAAVLRPRQRREAPHGAELLVWNHHHRPGYAFFLLGQSKHLRERRAPF